MLPEKPGVPGGSESDRKVWDALAALPEAKDLVAKAEAALSSSIPDLPDDWYLEFNRIGNREHYQKPFSERSTALQHLILGECLERKGRFVSKAAEFIGAICRERSWTYPAHDADLGNFNGDRLSVDLGSGARAWLLAVAVGWLKDSLPYECARRVRAEVGRRVFAPYLKTARGQDPEYVVDPFVNNVGDWWFAFPNNWNAVCHSCVVRTALALVESREGRAEFVEAAERTRDSYHDAFTDDGYCDEGMGYWNYGYGHELTLALFVRRATGGKVDLLKAPKNRSIMLYPYGYHLQLGLSPHFADGGGNPKSTVLALGRKAWPDIVSTPALSAKILEGSLESIALLAFDGEPLPTPPGPYALDRLPLRTYFPDAQVLISRTAFGSRPFSVAMKGGHNAELHNHNDIGSYVVMLDGSEMAGDPGGEVYTRRTFSPRRYESKVLSSYAHPVPMPAGTLQSQGRRFAGKVLKADFSDVRDVYALDLKAAYESPALKRLTRRLEFNRAGMAATIKDSVEFSSPCSFLVPVVTYCDVEKGKDSFVLRSKSGRRVRVAVAVKGAAWRLSEEIVPNPGKPDVRRLAVELSAPVERADVSVRYEAL